MHLRTPLIPSLPLSRLAGHPVHLKLENTQPTGSFKLRGIGRFCRVAAAAGARRFVSSSGGNAGLAAAHAARRLGIPALVVVPTRTDERMRALIEAEGAEVVLHGDAWADADARARELAQARDGTYLHPFDHPDIWAGHATLVDELAEDLRDPPGCVIASVGGGGLLAGVLAGLRARGWNDTAVLAAETEGAASLAAAVAAGRPVTLDRLTSVARSLGAPRVAQGVFDLVAAANVTPWVVSDAAAVDACRRFLDDHRMLVEPACGAALSAVYGRAPTVIAARSTVAVVCGGAGITTAELAALSERLGPPT
jgi:L-serine/L-threonine ammonia-lyase